MSEKNRLDRKIDFQNTFHTKRINIIIDRIGPSVILRSIVSTKILYSFVRFTLMKCSFMLHFIWIFTVCKTTKG